MHSWKSAHRSFAASSLLLALLACDGERLRPGPPTITLDGPPSGTVFSPETLGVVVRASDANGLDSVAVGYLGDIAVIHGDARTSVEDIVFVRLPAGLNPGHEVVITGTAVDLSGFVAIATLTLTVIAPP